MKKLENTNTLRTNNRKPTHPGEILREDILPALNMTQLEFANCLGVSRRSVSQILNEHRELTVDMAMRLAHFLGTTPESWLSMQQALDIWELERKNMRIYLNIKKVYQKICASHGMMTAPYIAAKKLKIAH